MSSSAVAPDALRPTEGSVGADEGEDRFDPRAFARSHRLSPAEAQRHTRVVRYMRLVIPAAAAGLVMTYMISAAPSRVDPAFLNSFTQADVDSSAMKLDRPRYAGEDMRGLPFEVSAKTAARDPNAPELISLENPEAMRSVAQKDGADAVNVVAKSGTLNTETKRIDLSEDVQLQHSLGGKPIIFNTDTASVDLNENTITSDAGVKGEGDSGTLAADSVTVFQGEGRAVFEGNVRLRIEPKTSTEDTEDELR